jgi:beta-phosphoglucomutase-like phosphatase (HAD superfamily)
MTEPRRALILDCDGVLVDTEPVHFECWNLAFDELLGLRVPGDHTQLVGLTLDEIYRLWAGSQTLTDEARARVLARKTELFYTVGQGRLVPMPGSLGLIQRARSLGWYVSLVSRAYRLRLHRTLEMAGMPSAFDAVLGYEDAVDPATDQKNHARAAIMFSIDPANSLVVEDSLSGVRDARACGIGRVVGLTTSLSAAALREAGAHEVVNHLSEIQIEPTP